MGEQKNPGDSTDFLTPKLTDLPARSFVPYSPFDYMGLPTNTTGIFKYVTAFHSRAINLIWNEYYRDQDLQNSRPVPTNDGPDNIDANLYQILPARNKRKDYFGHESSTIHGYCCLQDINLRDTIFHLSLFGKEPNR